jgi:hypothetical protein
MKLRLLRKGYVSCTRTRGNQNCRKLRKRSRSGCSVCSSRRTMTVINWSAQTRVSTVQFTKYLIRGIKNGTTLSTTVQVLIKLSLMKNSRESFKLTNSSSDFRKEAVTINEAKTSQALWKVCTGSAIWLTLKTNSYGKCLTRLSARACSKSPA